MSRGPGKLQSTIVAFFKKRPFAAVALSDLYWLLDRPETHSSRTAIMRAVRKIAERGGMPLAWRQRVGRAGNPLIIYRTDNETAVKRAERLCTQMRNDWTRSPSWQRPYVPPHRYSQVIAETKRMTQAQLGAVGAIVKLLRKSGKEPSAEAIVDDLGDIIPLPVIRKTLAEVHARFPHCFTDPA